MKVIEYIKENGIQSLKENLGILVREYSTFDILNYNQIMVDLKFHEIVRECRGLILNKTHNQVYCRSFDRFYNYTEEEIEYPDFGKAKVFEKLDGTLINIWWNQDSNVWELSTRKSLGELSNQWGNSFQDLVEKALGVNLQVKCQGLHKAQTYQFELTTPENRIVTPYEKYQLRFIGMRNNVTGWDIGCNYAALARDLGFETPEEIKGFKSLEEVKQAANNLDKLQEGFVVVWPNGFRLKIKNDAYVKLARSEGVNSRIINNGILPLKQIMAIVSDGEMDEYLISFPEDSEMFIEAQEVWKYLLNSLQDIYDNYKGIESRADFANSVKHLDESYVLFKLRDGKNLYEVMEAAKSDYKLELMCKYQNNFKNLK